MTMFWLKNLNEAVKSDPSVCPAHCGRKFGGQNRKANLKYHLIKNCGKIFICPICSKTFMKGNNLKYHLGLVHKIVA